MKLRKRMLVLCMLVFLQLFVIAALPQEAKAATHTNEWVKVNGKMVYYNSKGAKLMDGIKTIGTKKYLFTATGVQRTGWQKIDGAYYFFRVADGKSGYMLKSTTVNGIKLADNGKAKLTDYAKTKLPVLIKANEIRQSKTNANMTKGQKLKACWNYILTYQYRGSPTFSYSSNWDCKYASVMFRDKHGSCYHYGAAFAYLANACGYGDCKAVSSGGHGWAEINGYIFDPSWQLVDGKNHSYYHLDPALSGKGTIPGYKNNRKYVKTI